jgi:hypothetical protein
MSHVTRKLTPIEALRVIEDLAENAGLDRARFHDGLDGKTTVEQDEVLSAIYMMAHAARCAVELPECGGGHDDWHAVAVEAHDRLVSSNT